MGTPELQTKNEGAPAEPEHTPAKPRHSLVILGATACLGAEADMLFTHEPDIDPDDMDAMGG